MKLVLPEADATRMTNGHGLYTIAIVAACCFLPFCLKTILELRSIIYLHRVIPNSMALVTVLLVENRILALG